VVLEHLVKGITAATVFLPLRLPTWLLVVAVERLPQEQMQQMVRGVMVEQVRHRLSLVLPYPVAAVAAVAHLTVVLVLVGQVVVVLVAQLQPQRQEMQILAVAAVATA
jgi:hypothetical protein